MLYRQKKDTYIRNYDGAGYITSTGIWNDRMVNESGTIFLCALSREPPTLDELVEKFYETLIEDGFIIKGEPMLPKFKEFLLTAKILRQ